MPSAYININDMCTHTHTRAHRTGEMGENRRDVLMGLLLLLLLLPHSEKWKDKKKVAHWYLKYSAKRPHSPFIVSRMEAIHCC